VIVLKNGTERHLTLIPDFRFLYFTNADGRRGKIDLAETKSVEFLAPAK
jgi:hypothetical protein